MQRLNIENFIIQKNNNIYSIENEMIEFGILEKLFNQNTHMFKVTFKDVIFRFLKNDVILNIEDCIFKNCIFENIDVSEVRFEMKNNLFENCEFKNLKFIGRLEPSSVFEQHFVNCIFDTIIIQGDIAYNGVYIEKSEVKNLKYEGGKNIELMKI